MSELQKDIEKLLLELPEAERDAQRTEFGIFVVHNKRKPKLGKLPTDLPCVSETYMPVGAVTYLTISQTPRRYFAGAEIDDIW